MAKKPKPKPRAKPKAPTPAAKAPARAPAPPPVPVEEGPKAKCSVCEKVVSSFATVGTDGRGYCSSACFQKGSR